MNGRARVPRAPRRAVPRPRAARRRTEPERRPAVSAWAVTNPGFALTLLGVIAYGFLRIDYQVFYGRLDAAPEDVGLGYGQVLSQSAVNLLVFAVVVLVLLGGWWFAFRLWVIVIRMWATTLAPEIRGVWRSGRRAPTRIAGVALLLLVPTGLVVVLLVPVPGAVRLTAFVLAIALLVLGAPRSRPDASSRQPRVRPRPAAGIGLLERWRQRRVLVYRFAALSVALVLAFAVVAAAVDANNARRGIPVRRAHSWLSLESWSAERVRVQWVGAATAPGADVATRDCLLYLGQSGGTSAFFDARAKHGLRLPAAGILIEIIHADTPCS